MKWYYCLLLVVSVIIVCPFVFGVYVNEIMYNPEGSDTGKEFVELNVGNLSLENFIVGDVAANYTLHKINNVTSSLVLIVENATVLNLSTLLENATVYTAQRLGNGLNNQGDTFFLYTPQGELVLSFSYNNTVQEGKSLEFDGFSYLSSSVLGGTPGQENSVMFHENSSQLPEPENTSCFFTVSTDKENYENGEPLVIHFNTTQPFDEIEYGIETLEGDIVKPVRFTSNLKPKSWKTKTKNRYESFVIRAIVSSELCTLETTKTIKVHNSHTSSQKNVTSQHDVYSKDSFAPKVFLGADNLLRFGDYLSVRVPQLPVILNGSRTSQIHIVLKNQRVTLLDSIVVTNNSVITQVIPANCDAQYDEGVYALSVERLRQDTPYEEPDTYHQEIPIFANHHCPQKSTVRPPQALPSQEVQNSLTNKSSTPSYFSNHAPQFISPQEIESQEDYEIATSQAFQWRDVISYSFMSLALLTGLFFLKSRLTG